MQLELMSPAGDWAAMRAAIDNGADSVYFGVDQLNMRARATMNFTSDDLKKIAHLCSSNQVKSYLTLNTILYDHDLKLAKKIIQQAKESGISAIIASDIAAILYAKEIQLPVHISTQQNITNIEAVKFFSQFADVVVLSRELSLNQIQKISEQIQTEQIKAPNGELMRLEVFAHGALCMAVSGKCYLSLHTQNASANRGACVQNCRRKYKVTDLEDGHELEIDNEYIMSPKDLNTIGFLDQIIQAGCNVIKIEGRGKAPEYVAAVTSCYREAIDSIVDGSYCPEKVEMWQERLNNVFNRGFWGGYFLGQKLGEWTNSPGSKAKYKKVYVAKVDHYYPRSKIGEFTVEAENLKQGDKIVIIGPTTGVLEQEAAQIMVDETFVAEVSKGTTFTLAIDQRLRKTDRLYKLVENN